METPFDGILGLGYATLARGAIVPPLQNMLEQELLDEPVFSFWLNKQTKSEMVGGELRFGTVDKDRFRGELQWFPVLHRALLGGRIGGGEDGRGEAWCECTGCI